MSSQKKDIRTPSVDVDEVHVALKYREKMKTICWHVLAATGGSDPDKLLCWVPWDPSEPSTAQMFSIQKCIWMSSYRCQDGSTVLRVVEGRPWGLNKAEMALAVCVHMGAWCVPFLSHLKGSRAGLLRPLKNLLTKVSI